MKTLIVFLYIGFGMHSVNSQWIIRDKKQYSLFNKRIVYSYKSGQDQCAIVDAVLAILSDPKEIAWMKTQIPRPPVFEIPYRYYVGAQRNGSEFTWDDGVPLPDDSHLWGRRQPGSGNFVFMGSEYSVSRSFPLYSTTGALKNGHYICEKQWPPPTEPPETTPPETTYNDETTVQEEDTTLGQDDTTAGITTLEPTAADSTDEATAWTTAAYGSGGWNPAGYQYSGYDYTDEDEDKPPKKVTPDIFGNYEDTTISVNGTNASRPFMIIGASGGGAALIIIVAVAFAIVKRAKTAEAEIVADDSINSLPSIVMETDEPTSAEPTGPSKRRKRQSVYFRAKTLASKAKMNVFSMATLYVDPTSQMDMV